MLKFLRTLSSTAVSMLSGTVRVGGVATSYMEEFVLQAREKQVTISRAEMNKEIDQELLKYKQFLDTLSAQDVQIINQLKDEMKNYKF